MDEVINKVSETLKKEDDVLALFLFGSRAINENTKNSDYDFYVILDNNTKDSLREDEISRKVHEATEKFNQEIHLTFQYLFIVNEDKSLILKISSEGKLLFSKTYLIAQYKQFGLQRCFICKWEIDEKKFISGNKKELVRNSKLLISRMLHGYVQKYSYNGKQKESVKKGLVDNKTIFGVGEIIIVPDIMFEHMKYFIEQNRGEVSIINSCYIPADSIEGISKYYLKKDLERIIKIRKKIDKALFITSIDAFDSDKVHVKFECTGKKQTTIIPIKELPENMQKNISQEKYEFA
jgi:predicted nucleotidyltransferase